MLPVLLILPDITIRGSSACGSRDALRLYGWAKKHAAAGTRRVTLEETRKNLGLESVKDADGNIIREAPLAVWANFRERARRGEIEYIHRALARVSRADESKARRLKADDWRLHLRNQA